MKSYLHKLRDLFERDVNSILAVDLRLNLAEAFYAVLMSETALRPSGSFLGMYHPSMHRWLQGDIGDRWKGNGPAVIVDDRAMLAISRYGHDRESDLVGTLQHELGHVIDEPGMFTPDVTDCGLTLRHPPTQVFVNRTNEPDDTYFVRSPRSGHSWTWIRCCLHLNHRMALRGWDIPLPEVIDRQYYAISPPIEYRRGLGDELTRLESVPLTLLREVEPPESFVNLWDEDNSRYPDEELVNGQATATSKGNNS